MVRDIFLDAKKNRILVDPVKLLYEYPKNKTLNIWSILGSNDFVILRLGKGIEVLYI